LAETTKERSLTITRRLIEEEVARIPMNNIAADMTERPRMFLPPSIVATLANVEEGPPKSSIFNARSGVMFYENLPQSTRKDNKSDIGSRFDKDSHEEVRATAAVGGALYFDVHRTWRSTHH
jgi:hypothetical protein